MVGFLLLAGTISINSRQCLRCTNARPAHEFAGYPTTNLSIRILFCMNIDICASITIAVARSDNYLPAIGPSSLSAVIEPLSDTSFIGESYLNNVTTIGPFSPC